MWKNTDVPRSDVTMHPGNRSQSYRALLQHVSLTCERMQMYPGQMYTTPLIEPSATGFYYTMSVWYVAECRCTQMRPFCHNTHVNWLKCFHVTVYGRLSLCQWSKLLCIYVLLNTWCTWLTVMDRIDCVGCSTDGTTLCCRHVSNSWQSTLKNIHVVNTYLCDDFHYDLILAYSIYVNQILSLTTLIIIVHGFSCTRKYKRLHDKWHQKCISVLFALVHGVNIWQKYHIKITSNVHFVVCVVFAYVARTTNFTKKCF